MPRLDLGQDRVEPDAEADAFGPLGPFAFLFQPVGLLPERSLVRCVKQPTGGRGRPAERWYAVAGGGVELSRLIQLSRHPGKAKNGCGRATETVAGAAGQQDGRGVETILQRQGDEINEINEIIPASPNTDNPTLPSPGQEGDRQQDGGQGDEINEINEVIHTPTAEGSPAPMPGQGDGVPHDGGQGDEINEINEAIPDPQSDLSEGGGDFPRLSRLSRHPVQPENADGGGDGRSEQDIDDLIGEIIDPTADKEMDK
jgi:hypothetical protein